MAIKQLYVFLSVDDRTGEEGFLAVQPMDGTGLAVPLTTTNKERAQDIAAHINQYVSNMTQRSVIVVSFVRDERTDQLVSIVVPENQIKH